MDELLREQIDYYDARADEYDDFWLRRGAYALPEPLASQWAVDTRGTEALVEATTRGSVLELACGTGLFTRLLVRGDGAVHAVDASERMLELNRQRLGPDRPGLIREHADLFAWEPARTYDSVVFTFWLSHVPDERFEAFWAMVDRALAPGGRVIVVDSVPMPGSTPDPGSSAEQRRLSDGRRFRVLKRYWTPQALSEHVGRLGWTGIVDDSPNGLVLRARLERPADAS